MYSTGNENPLAKKICETELATNERKQKQYEERKIEKLEWTRTATRNDHEIVVRMQGKWFYYD